MKGEKLKIEIDEATGEVTVLAEGFVGHGCSAIQDAISRDLGTVTEERKTADYHKVAVKKTLTTGR
jgi:Protein of unknown function (DUF2997)